MNSKHSTPRVFIAPGMGRESGGWTAKIIEPGYIATAKGGSIEEAITNLLEKAYQDRNHAILEAIEEDSRYVNFHNGTIVDFDYHQVGPYQVCS